MSFGSKFGLLLALGCGPAVKYGTVPRPCPALQMCEVLDARAVELVWPFPDGHYIAVSGNEWCPLDGADGLKPWTIREGDLLVCRWRA